MYVYREDVEEIILKMADIVLENRRLRAENERLLQIEKKHNDYVQEMCKAAEQSSFNMLQAVIAGYEQRRIDLRKVGKQDGKE